MTYDRQPEPPRGGAAQKGRRRPFRRLKWGAGGVVLVATVTLVTFAGLKAGFSGPEQARSGAPVPDLQMTDFDGEILALSDYKGTPLVVNFWASWCPSCVAEMPAFEKVYQSFRGSVEFIGINHSDTRSAAERLAEETGVTYRLAEDPRGEVFAAFGGNGMPTTAFIDASGNVVDVIVGQFTEDILIEFIRESFPGVG